MTVDPREDGNGVSNRVHIGKVRTFEYLPKSDIATLRDHLVVPRMCAVEFPLTLTAPCGIVLASLVPLRHAWAMQRLVRVFEDFVYGFDGGVDVPMEAAHALVRGLDAPALVDLAGLHRDQTLDIGDLIPVVAEQLGTFVPARDAVVEQRMRETAADYLAGNKGFRDSLSNVLWWFMRYFEEGSYRCCDSMLWLDLWLSSGEFDDWTYWYGSPEAAETAFREHCSAVVEGRPCPKTDRQSSRG